MQNLVYVVVIVAALAMGVGYLSNSNGVGLWIQQVGVGETNLESPITSSALTINIERLVGATLVGETVQTGAFKDFIVDCVFRSPDKDLEEGTTLFCKLLDGQDFETAFIISEGSKILDSFVPAGTPITIPIDQIIDNSVGAVNNIVIVIQDP